MILLLLIISTVVMPTVGAASPSESGVVNTESSAVPSSTLRVVASPWGTTLNDSQLTFEIGPNAPQSSFNGSTLSITTNDYPIMVNVSLFRGETPLVVTIVQPSHDILEINSSKLVVSALVNDNTIAGASIEVNSGNNGTIASAISSSRASVFYLPQGNYSVKATLGNATRTSYILSQTGKVSDMLFDFIPSNVNGPSYFSTNYLLTVTGIAGLALSATVWIKLYWDRRIRAPKSNEHVSRYGMTENPLGSDRTTWI